MDYPVVSKEELDEILKNEDIHLDGYEPGEPEEQPEETIESHEPTNWKHAIYMGLISGLLWAVSAGGLIGGIISLIKGFTNDSGGVMALGVVLLVVAITFGICAKHFHEKVKYGEV